MQTAQLSGTIEAFSPCLSYWVLVTAIDNLCSDRLVSRPQAVDLFQPVQFKFFVTLDNDPVCSTWIADNSARKISDVQREIASQSSSCGTSASCIANGQFKCEGDPAVITYK